MHELALFAGIGGGILGTELLGYRCRVACERDSYARSVLLQRQQDRCFRHMFPIWDDVRTFNGLEWRGDIDLVSGGFPCQDISSANRGATGLRGSRSGLWGHMARVIDECVPRYVFIENSPNLASRGLDIILRDLAALGFDAEWGVLGASVLGAPHARKRLWLLAAHSDMRRQRTQQIDAEEPSPPEPGEVGGPGWWAGGPVVSRVDAWVARRMDRTRATGNCQVPAVAATAFSLLLKRLQS